MCFPILTAIEHFLCLFLLTKTPTNQNTRTLEKGKKKSHSSFFETNFKPSSTIWKILCANPIQMTANVLRNVKSQPSSKLFLLILNELFSSEMLDIFLIRFAVNLLNNLFCF